jgi:hypothetical protein
MGDVILSTGTMPLDLSTVTHKEWRVFFRGTGTEESDAEFIRKISGLNKQQQDDMAHVDFRRLIDAILFQGNNPLAVPNSPSASTSGS